jgi:hypothetical protein
MPRHRPPLTIEQILAWADAHKQHTGCWPHCKSGVIADAPDETWSAVNTALTCGGRGLSPGSSLARLLKECRGGCAGEKPALTTTRILWWAEVQYRRTGQWPRASSGSVLAAPEENWGAIDTALRTGSRGLPGGESLNRLLRRHRGLRCEPADEYAV